LIYNIIKNKIKSLIKLKNLIKVGYVLLFILIVSIVIYDNVYSKNYNIEHGLVYELYIENPQKYGGFKTESFGKIINISEDHFYFNSGNENIKVFGLGIKKPIFGETAVFLDYKKDGRIELIDYHNYDFNYFLYITSFLAIIVFITIFLKEWKITWKGFKDA
jgi:hypothetical protein